MAEIYPLGKNTIFYRPQGFTEGLTVTVDMVDPDLENHNGIILTELEKTSEFDGGLYYFEYNFIKEGTYIGIFYEEGEKVTSQAFSTRRIPTQGLRILGSGRLINRG